jgi:tight adherence protein B
MTDALVRLLVLLAIFGSIFLLSQMVLGSAWQNRARVAAVNRRLRLIREGRDRAEVVANLRKNAPREFNQFPEIIAGWLRSIQRSLFMAAVPYNVSQTLAAMGLGVAVVFVALVAGVWYSSIPLGPGVILLLLALAAAIGIALPILVISRIALNRRKRMEQQFPVSLDVFVRALRSGHPVAAAIELLTHEMEDPIGSEFGLVSDEVAYGADLTEAIYDMAERWDLDDMRMFVVSLSVQMETGGNLAEILENLSDVIRQRASLYLKVRALSSEGRMTGWMLTVLPVITFVGMFMVNPRFYLDVARDPIFMFGFPSLMILYFIGVFWIRNLVNLKV